MRLSSRRKLPAGNGLKGSAGRRERHNNGKTLLLPGTAPKLHSSDEVPSWYAHNAYILTGYRPVTHSLQSCIRSLAYTHNETVNIYSHLVPAALALLCNYCFGSYFPSRFPQASWADQLVFHIYLSTSTICFGTSSAYHTLLCHSEHCAGLWSRLDYVGIIFQILGTFVSGIYVGFYCEPNFQKLYWAMIGSLGAMTGFVATHPRLQSMEWKTLRLSTFLATGLSAFAPIMHAALIFPYDQLDKQAGLRYYYLEGILILTGVAFYATHFPEIWKPMKFDLWGASHQVFHFFVVLGASLHFYGILKAFEWNYINQRCKLA